MTIYIKELKQSAKAWGIWTGAISFMLFVCIMMFPEMKDQMDSVTSVFSNMGDFTSAFGMDKLSFGEFMGFTELSAAMYWESQRIFAALAGISVLAGEEKEHTAEFLLTHPVSRVSVLTQKLMSVLTQIIAMNMIIVGISLISSAIIGESFQMREFILLHTAYLILQLEIACICFGISAFIRRGSIGIGLGLALALYFMNIVCNISEQAEFLKYITPYAYADASDIITEAGIEPVLTLTGAAIAFAGIIAGYLKYTRKDINS